MQSNPSSISPKSALTALLLCLFLGMLGAHRFYLGKTKSAVLMLITLGGFGIWALIDLIVIDCNEGTDGEGRALRFGATASGRGSMILRILAIFVGIVPMYAASIALVVLLGTDGMTSTVNGQLKAIRYGDLDKAYLYTSSGFQEETSKSTFKSFVDAYPIIKNNSGASFSTREIENNQGYLSGEIYDKNGDSINIEYQMIYEDHMWKILGLRVNQGEAENAQDDEATNAASNSPVETVSTKDLTYTDTAGKYSIKYPDNWMYEKTDPNSVMFSGKKGSAAYASTITVQVLPMKKSGGIYKNAKAIVDDLKKQIDEKTTNVKFLREGNVELPLNPKEFKGYFFEVSYTYRGVAIKKMQFIMVNPAGTMGYSWGYTTDTSRYDTDLPVAKAMYESWDIKK